MPIKIIYSDHMIILQYSKFLNLISFFEYRPIQLKKLQPFTCSCQASAHVWRWALLHKGARIKDRTTKPIILPTEYSGKEPLPAYYRAKNSDSLLLSERKHGPCSWSNGLRFALYRCAGSGAIMLHWRWSHRYLNSWKGCRRVSITIKKYFFKSCTLCANGRNWAWLCVE